MTKKIWNMGAGASVLAGITVFALAGSATTTYTQILGGFTLSVGLVGMVILIRRDKK